MKDQIYYWGVVGVVCLGVFVGFYRLFKIEGIL